MTTTRMMHVNVDIVAHELDPKKRYLFVVKGDALTQEDLVAVGDGLFKMGVDSMGIYVDNPDDVKVIELPIKKVAKK